MRILRFLPILLFMLSYSCDLFSQAVMFDYDENGNRYIRKVITFNYANKLSDSTSTLANNYDTSNVRLDSVNSSIFGNRVTLFPNPVKYNISVYIQNIQGKNIEVSVADMNGKPIEKLKINYNTTVIDFSTRTSGVYLLKVSINGRSEVYKVIKE